eukprot:475920-Pelagomonas_calceolata.AAC.2
MSRFANLASERANAGSGHLSQNGLNCGLSCLMLQTRSVIRDQDVRILRNGGSCKEQSISQTCALRSMHLLLSCKPAFLVSVVVWSNAHGSVRCWGLRGMMHCLKEANRCVVFREVRPEGAHDA